jgi:uncharacterized protein YjbI with pentapeptide repeats
MAKESAPASGGFEPPKYLTSLIAAINDGAKTAQAGMLLYLLVGLYLLATAFSSTDEDLLLGKAVTIAQIGASLPVGFSFAIAPFVFVFLHVYSLSRFDMLAANLRHFTKELRETVPSLWDRERCRQLLSNVEFILVFAAPRGSSLHNLGWLGMVVLLLAVFPVAILLLVQINALRYQSDSILWAQRAALLIDLAALTWFFLRNPLGNAGRTASWPRRAVRWTVLAALLILVLVPTFGWIKPASADADANMVRYRNNWLYDEAGGKVRDEQALRELHPFLSFFLDRLKLPLKETIQAHPILADLKDAVWQPFDVLTCPRLAWGCRYLRVERRTLVAHVWDDKAMIELRTGGADRTKVLAAIEGVQLRGRSLMFAVLTQSRLYGAEMLGVELQHALLDKTNLSGANLSFAHLAGASLAETQLAGSDLGWAWLDGAYLHNAELTGANLREAQLADSDLSEARLGGAVLIAAQLTGADLSHAQLAGANLYGAQLIGANLGEAQLTGADLGGAQLSGAFLRGAQLTGADLAGARLTGADLSGAQVSGAALSGARLDGADLRNVRGGGFVPTGVPNLGIADLRHGDFLTSLSTDELRKLECLLAMIPEGEQRAAARNRLQPLLDAKHGALTLRVAPESAPPILVSRPIPAPLELIDGLSVAAPGQGGYRNKLADLLVTMAVDLTPQMVVLAPVAQGRDALAMASSIASRAERYIYESPFVSDLDDIRQEIAEDHLTGFAIACKLLTAADLTPPRVSLEERTRNRLARTIADFKPRDFDANGCPKQAGAR